MSKSTTISGTAMTGASKVHDETETCEKCKYWMATKAYDLDKASRLLVDADRIVQLAYTKRSHGIHSEAHFHYKGADCNERCVA